MILKKIKASNFRNYSDLDVEFLDKITVLKGENAQGKTNFLESIFFLATGKAIRSESDEEIVRFGEESVNVEGNILGRDKNTTDLTAIILKTEESLRKKFLVNGIPRRLLDYAGVLVVVYFRPEDIDLVTGSPSIRREYIDNTISQIDRDYRKILSSYQKLITQKNKLLKLIREGLAKNEELFFWNEKQIEMGEVLQRKRQEFFDSINSYEKKFGESFYKYIPNEINEDRLKTYYEREIQSAVCLIGPHRDDFIFFQGEKDLAKYGSRGEQRTSVLDLKITELSYFENVLGERPVLLLDDIFSELDASHRQHVIDLARLQQTIIATVEYDEYLKNELKNEQIFTIGNGRVNP